MDEVRKVTVPEGALRVEIDDPPNRRIEQPVGTIRGWFASRDEEISEAFEFQVAGIKLSHTIERREDVEGALPGYTIVGFKMHYDLSDYLPDIQGSRLGIRLVSPGYEPYLLRFTVDDRCMAICLAAAGGV